MSRVSLTAVNRALHRAGHAERLAKGRGYFYFRGGDAKRWPITGVYVTHVEALTIEGWLAERQRLQERAAIPGPDFTFENHGRVWLVRMNSDAAREWALARLTRDARIFDDGIVVEPPQVASLAAWIRDNGLSSEGA